MGNTSSAVPPNALNPIQCLPTDETGNRVANTPYQNKTGKPLMITIGMNYIVLQAGDSAEAALNVDSVSGGISFGCDSGIHEYNEAVPLTLLDTLTFIVPPNFFYELDSTITANGSVIIEFWFEQPIYN